MVKERSPGKENLETERKRRTLTTSEAEGGKGKGRQSNTAKAKRKICTIVLEVYSGPSTETKKKSTCRGGVANLVKPWRQRRGPSH